MKRTRLIALTLLTVTLLILGSCDFFNSMLGLPNPAETLPDGVEITGTHDLTGLASDGWDYSADDLAIPAASGKWHKITVPARDSTTLSNVWGSNPYSGDSRLACAALHAGAITQSGGVFYIQTGGADSGFYASTANGVSTIGYEPDWATSFVVYKAP